MSNFPLTITGEKAGRGTWRVTLMSGETVVMAREVRPHQTADVEAFIASAQVALPGLNGEAEQLRHQILQLAKPKQKRQTESSGGWQPDRLTQQVNAEQLVRQLDGKARFNVSRKLWMVENEAEGRIVPDEKGFVERVAKAVARRTWAFVGNSPDGIDPKVAFKHAIESERATGIAAAMKLAQTEPGISIVESDLDSDGYQTNLINGVYDFREMKFREHRRTDLFSKLAPVKYDPTATCPLWDRFFRRIMADNDAMMGYLQRLAGLALSSVVPQEFYVCWGGGANGKNVFWDTLLGMSGDYGSMAADSLLTIGRGSEHPTEKADLCGKRLIVANETEEGAKLRVQLVKQLTGNAIIKARFMRHDFFEFLRTFKLILVTNNKPTIGEETHAIWRRVRLIPFSVVIPEKEQDEKLLDKLRLEWSGILNWAIAGFADFKENGLQTPAEVQVATTKYRDAQNTVAEYVAERCILDPAAYVCRHEIHADYQTWTKSTIDRNAFYDRLRRFDGIGEDQRRVGGSPKRIFTGIGLADLSSQYRQATERAGVTA